MKLHERPQPCASKGVCRISSAPGSPAGNGLISPAFRMEMERRRYCLRRKGDLFPPSEKGLGAFPDAKKKPDHALSPRIPCPAGMSPETAESLSACRDSSRSE